MVGEIYPLYDFSEKLLYKLCLSLYPFIIDQSTRDI